MTSGSRKFEALVEQKMELVKLQKEIADATLKHMQREHAMKMENLALQLTALHYSSTCTLYQNCQFEKYYAHCNINR